MQYHLSLSVCKKQVIKAAHNQEEENWTPLWWKDSKEFVNMF